MEKGFFTKLGVDEDELLALVRRERQEGEDFSYQYKLEVEADLKLLKNLRDKKKDEKLVGDSTLFNVHTALFARSYQSKNQIKFKGDKSGTEREIKMLNAVMNEDMESAEMKALRYYLYDDKYSCGVSIQALQGWDGVYKRNKFQIVNPLTWVPDPNGDYFTGNYKYTGFFSMKSRGWLEANGYDVDDLQQKAFENGAIEQRQRMQRIQGLYPDKNIGRDVFDVYNHFTTVNGKKIAVMTANLNQVILDAKFIEPGSPLEEKNPEAICFPFAFYYWKPDRENCFGRRPADFVRDVQYQKAEIANLRLNKMRAELYPMYLYNKDYVSGKDLSFGFNKGIPVSTGIDGANVNLDNIVRPIVKDLRIDTSFAVEQSLDRQVEKSTSIGEVVQGTTPTKRETLGTNNLISSNTDVNLQLNEEVHAIGDEQFVKLWFSGYYRNFASGDKKLVYAGSSTGQTAIVLNRKEFVYEGNLNLSIESSIMVEERKRKESAATLQVTPLILPSLNAASKLKYLRFFAERAGVPQEVIDETLIDTPQMAMQNIENELLKLNIPVNINPDDNDEEHLVTMGSSIDTEAFDYHKVAHIQAMIAKGTVPAASMQGQIDQGSMTNSMASQAQSAAISDLRK